MLEYGYRMCDGKGLEPQNNASLSYIEIAYKGIALLKVQFSPILYSIFIRHLEQQGSVCFQRRCFFHTNSLNHHCTLLFGIDQNHIPNAWPKPVQVESKWGRSFIVYICSVRYQMQCEPVLFINRLNETNLTDFCINLSR